MTTKSKTRTTAKAKSKNKPTAAVAPKTLSAIYKAMKKNSSRKTGKLSATIKEIATTTGWTPRTIYNATYVMQSQKMITKKVDGWYIQ